MTRRIGRKHFGLIPTGYDGPHAHAGPWMYAVGYHDGSIKVGYSCRPRERVVTHCRLARGAVSWAHAFPCLLWRDARRVEKDALRRLCALAQPIKGKETFVLPRDAVFCAVRAAYATQYRAG